jgi:hypothetical protein
VIEPSNPVIVAHGNTLITNTGMALSLAAKAGQNVSLDTTGGLPNTFSGSQGGIVASPTGAASIKTGADTIVGGIAAYATSVSIDSIGANISGGGLTLDGIYAQGGAGPSGGPVVIGGLNGGIASNITAPSGWGIYATDSSNTTSVTLASTGIIVAEGGIFASGKSVTIDNFGSITATTQPAISTSSILTLTLENGSTTNGKVQFGNGGINIFTGANISSTTFSGSGSIDFKGTGAGTFDLKSESGSKLFRKTIAARGPSSTQVRSPQWNPPLP